VASTPNVPRRDLSGRTVLVTGAGPGSIGLATAQTLADWGAEVVVTTRSAPVRGLAWHPLDLAERRSVDAFADWVLDRYGERLDAVVNNAGIHLDLRSRWSQPQLLDGHEVHWRTNYLGSAQLTRRLVPALLARAADTGEARVVHVASKLHRRGSNAAMFDGVRPYDSWTAYGTSKLALVHDAAELYRRHEKDGLRAFSVHPGSVFTHIADRGLESSPVLARVRAMARPLERRALLTPEQGAQTTLHCLTDPDVRHGYFRECAAAEPSVDALDVVASGRLWDETQRWIDRGSGR
jgi:NAD(P)-dependent dehydrogenase (short-subunit alcohol dehydrogenase family)